MGLRAAALLAVRPGEARETPPAVPAPMPSIPYSLPADTPRAALLCNGPSLPRYWSEDKAAGYALVVAVNTAGWKYSCDWMAAIDAAIWRTMWELRDKGGRTGPRVGVVTGGVNNMNEAKKRGLRIFGPPLQGKGFAESFRSLGRTPPSTVRSVAYTMPNALFFCYQRHRAVDIYGCDFSPSRTDFAGHRGDHGGHRWQREGAILRALWQPTFRVFSDMPSRVLAYLEGRIDKLSL